MVGHTPGMDLACESYTGGPGIALLGRFGTGLVSNSGCLTNMTMIYRVCKSPSISQRPPDALAGVHC